MSIVWILTEGSDDGGARTKAVYASVRVACADCLVAVGRLYGGYEITAYSDGGVEAYGGSDWARLTPHEVIEERPVDGDPVGIVTNLATPVRLLPITDNDPLF